MNEQTQETQKPVERLTNWKNAPSLKDLKQNYQDAKPTHDSRVAQINEWLDNLHMRGKAKPKSAPGNSEIAPKLIRKQAEWRYAALSEPFLSTYDLFNVKPKTWEDRKAAQQNKLLLNHQINNQVDKVAFIDEYVRTAVDEGTVVLRPGWEYDAEEYTEEVPGFNYIIDPQGGELIAQLEQMKAESPSEYATNVPDELKKAHQLSIERGAPVRPVPTGQMIKVTKTRVLKNQPTVDILSFQNVVIDPTCNGDIRKASFVVVSVETNLATLEKDKRYKNLHAINVQGSNPLNEPDHLPDGGQHNFNFADKARKKFVMYEYWGFWDIHKNGRLKPFVCSWVGETIIRMEEIPFPDRKLPFILVHYLPIRKSITGEPDGALLVDNQKVIGAVTRGMVDIMGKSANGQTGTRKDFLDVTNRRKFAAGDDYEFNPNVDPREGVYMHTYPEIPQSASFMLQLQNFEAESLTGVKSFSQGISGQSLGDVAAGIRGALDAASKRELGILRRLSAGIVELGRRFMAMNSEFLSEEEVVRVTNDQFVAVRRDDLAGHFDLELSISTAEEDNNKAEQLAFMFQTIGPNGDPGMTKMILSDIARLRKMPDLAHRIESYEPQPDPIQQKIQMLEIAKLEAEIAEIQARTQQLATGAQLNSAKAGTEVVKQGNLQADTDQKNLNFVEQESGVTQERNKELHGAQANAQAQLKILDNAFQSKENALDRQADLIGEYMKQKAAKKKAA